MSYASVIIGLGSVALALLFPPLAWHSKTKNTPAIIMIVWLILMNIKLIVDASIWGGSDFAERWAGYGWCDLTTKLQVGANVGISCTVANIAYNLHAILRADAVLPEPDSRRKICTDLGISLVTPILVMGLTYLVQVFRYGIFRYNGCQNMLSPSWLTVVTYTLWMFIWSLVGFIYAIMLLYVFYRKRKDVKDILHCTSSGLNIARFSRLLLFCVLIILVMFPFSLYAFASELHNLTGAYDYQEVHDRSLWSTILRIDIAKPLYSVWLYILMSYLVFVIFGLGTDAVGMYGSAARIVGLGPLLDKCKQCCRRRRSESTSKVVSYFFAEHDATKSAEGMGSASDGSSTFKPGVSYSDGSSIEMSDSTPSSPSHFIIDYLLPNEKSRREKRRRNGNGGDLESLSYLDLPASPINYEEEAPLSAQRTKSGLVSHVSYRSGSESGNTNGAFGPGDSRESLGPEGPRSVFS
ncbi:LAQU0S18e02322g1_1 [Lachancea quebecensis]|uniref:LAQU0S18e02322g1_1 n=1 Tax=Lachancea quebecensis TaxID=1654605 RepID=A0A0N7MMC3_9SACH|nr:LAQU0S18e02322g1_1 [Lachancea quebecensis]